MAKVLYVSSPVQAVLMKEIFIPELTSGFWKDHRPRGHGEVWRDVEVLVAAPEGKLGAVGFDSPRNYNLLNLDFSIPNEARLVQVAQSVKPNSTYKSVKKEVIELVQIIGARLTARDGTPIKLFRGNHKVGTVTYSSTKARRALGSMVTEVTAPVKIEKKETVKKTVVKVAHSPLNRTDSNINTIVDSDGILIRRALVKSA